MVNINKLINENNWIKLYKLIAKRKITPDNIIHNNNNILHLACINNKSNVIKLLLKIFKNLIIF